MTFPSEHTSNTHIGRNKLFQTVYIQLTTFTRARSEVALLSIHVASHFVKPFARAMNLDLLGPTQRGRVEVEDNIGSLERNIAEDVDANVSGRLNAAVALVAEDRLL